MRTTVICALGVAVFLGAAACNTDRAEYSIVAVPRNYSIAPGSEQKVDLYLVRKLDSAETQVIVEGEDYTSRVTNSGALLLSRMEHRSGMVKMKGVVQVGPEADEHLFECDYLVLPLPAQVSARQLIRGRKNLVEVGVPGIPGDRVTLAVTNAIANRIDGHYYITPDSRDTVQVSLFYTTEFGTRQQTAASSFSVVDDCP